MKLPILTILSAIAIAALVVPQTSFAKPASCQIALADGGRKTGFIARTNDKGILFTYSENEKGPGEQYTHKQVLAVVFTDEGDIMGPARHAYSRSNFEEAERLFKAVAEEYDNLWGISREQRGNFASEARYFQVDCLRRLGRYPEIAPAMQTNTGKSLDNTIAEVFLPNLKLFQMWEKLAGNQWDALAADLSSFEQQATGEKANLVPVPVFNADSPALLVQLTFMRGKVFAAKDDKENALRDFYRAMTLDYGSDPVLSQKAMDEALAIQSKNPKLKESYPQKTEIHALARVYQEGYAKGDIDIQFREFTREPEMPAALKKQLEAEKATEGAGEAEKAEVKPAAEEAKPAGKGKKKGNNKK